MILTTHCTACKKAIAIKSNASARPDLAMEKGESFYVNCDNCGKNQKKHVNDIRAGQNNLFLLGGVAISALVTLILWNFLGAIGTITGLIPVLIWQQQSNAAHAFNSYRIRR